MDKVLQLDDEHQKKLIIDGMRANLLAATLVEFYDTLHAGGIPEDLCKELTLMWFSLFKAMSIDE